MVLYGPRIVPGRGVAIYGGRVGPTDPDMYLMIEKGIRGGICIAVTRYAKANNVYLKDYNPHRRKSYFRYWDANNLYGCAMSKPLPVRNFGWMTENQLKNWREHPCFLEVDLKYPERLHDLHNDYPLAPERMRIGKVDKLICSLSDKEKVRRPSRSVKVLRRSRTGNHKDTPRNNIRRRGLAETLYCKEHGGT